MHRRQEMLETCPALRWYPVPKGECDMRVPQVSERIKEAPAQALRGVFAGIGQLLLVTDKLRNKNPAGKDAQQARRPWAAATVADTTVTSPAGQRGEKAAPPAEPAAPAPAVAVTEKPATAKPSTTRRAPAKPATTRRAPAGPAAAKPAAAKPAAAKPATARRAAAGSSPAAAGSSPAAAGSSPAAAGSSPAAAGSAPAEPAAADPPPPPKPQSTRDLDKTGNVRLLDADDGGSALDAAPPLPNYDELSVASLRARLRNLDIAQVRQLADYERAHAARADVVAMFERRIAKLEAET
jgi:hypothetical protein